VRAEFTTADSVTIPRHIATPRLATLMTVAALDEVGDPGTALRPSDDHGGGAAQRFLVEVVARRGTEERRAVARGRDIYGITGPLAAEAATRLAAGDVTRAGTLGVGEAFDAADLLASLPLGDLAVG
jgi:hypothetical protein